MGDELVDEGKFHKNISDLRQLQVLLMIKNGIRSASKMSYTDDFRHIYKWGGNRSITFFYRQTKALQSKGLIDVKERNGREVLYGLTRKGQEVLEDLSDWIKGNYKEKCREKVEKVERNKHM